MYRAEEIIDICLERTPIDDWFKMDATFDKVLRRRFMSYVLLAGNDELDDWQVSAKSCLALILLLDRVSRACFRNTILDFSNEKKAVRIALLAYKNQFHRQLTPLHQVFLLFPLMSSEKVEHQHTVRVVLKDLGRKDPDSDLQLIIKKLVSLVERNILLLRKFHRFPHRAQVKRIPLTEEERLFVTLYDWQCWL